MLSRKFSGSILAAALMFGVCTAIPAQARTWLGVSIGLAPPPVRVERVGIRAGYVWAPGYWRWSGSRHVWVGGRWLPARPGYHYVGAHWAHWGHGWRLRGGGWVHP